jgi:flagellar biosynthesis GTPase FlhF
MHMETSYTQTLRCLLASTILLCSVLGMAQGKFTVNGRLKIDGGDLGGARAVVYKDGVKERTVSTGLTKFSVDLDLNASYIISFEKDGFVSKKLSFNTHVPATLPPHGFLPFDFSVSLFKQYDDMNMVVFNQPVGVIRYEAAKGDFDYDTDYTKSIQSQLQQALAEVEQKRKEEARNASAEAKRKAAEEREQARAEAEARKKAEAVAREEQARAEELRREEEKRKAEARAEPTPEPVAAPVPRERANGHPHLAKSSANNETRRMATAVEGWEAPPTFGLQQEPVVREEELLVQSNKVETVIRLERAGVLTEYRRVSHKWGGVFFFKNGESCSQTVYETEALGDRDRLVDAVPRR